MEISEKQKVVPGGISDELVEKIKKFRDDRDWKQFHNPKDLAISINLEASELLENFQWTKNNEISEEKLKNIKEELADVLIYCILFADNIGINLENIIFEKIQINKKHYPIEKAYGNAKKYTELRGKPDDSL